MEKLSLKKKLLVIRLYTEGYSYSEIAARAGVGKGSIGTIITDLKAGRFPQFGDLSEHLELIRELAVDLRQSGLTPVQASVGVMVLSRLHKLGVEPSEIEGLSALYRTLTTEGTDMQSFIRVALSLEEIRKRTGLSVEELEIKVKDLEESASRLEPLAKEAADYEVGLTELTKQRESLAEEVSGLEERHEILEDNVRDKEQRETEISNRVSNLEDRAQSADERLTTTRKDLKELSGIGMSPDNLSAFAQRVKVVAQRHTMKPEVIYSKLMDELEQLDEGLGLDTINKAKNQELRRIDSAIRKGEDESMAISNTNEKLRQERSELKAVLSEERRHITNNIVAINRIAENTIAELEAAILEERRHITKGFEAIITAAENTIAELNQNLSSGIDESVAEVNKLRDRTLQLGKELGQYNEMIESNKWLKGLLALVKDDEVEPEKVRVIGITVLRSILSWMKHYYENSNSPWWLVSISNLIGELERWKP
jgi:septal ring factor EnvC (AmiA/AmiB activator)